MRLIYDLAWDAGKFNTRTDATPDPRTPSDFFLVSRQLLPSRMSLPAIGSPSQVHMLLLSFPPFSLFRARPAARVTRYQAALETLLAARQRHELWSRDVASLLVCHPRRFPHTPPPIQNPQVAHSHKYDITSHRGSAAAGGRNHSIMILGGACPSCEL